MLISASSWSGEMHYPLDEAALALTALLALWALCLRQTRGLDSSARWALLAIVPLRFGWAIGFMILAPNWVTSTDGERYLSEIDRIARGPLLWNPFVGTGPDYQGSAKLGMSWLYGTLAHVLDVSPLFLALLAGVVFSCLSALIAFEIAKQISSVAGVWLSSALLVALHPQSLYWSGKLVRESLSVFLIAALFLVGLRLMTRFEIRSFAMLVLLTLALSATRAQLGLFGPLVLIAVAAAHLRRRIWIAALTLGSIVLALPLLEAQIFRAGLGPRKLLHYLSPSPEFLLEAAAKVMTSPDWVKLASIRYGSYGAILVPFSLLAWCCLGFAIWKFRSIFSGARFQAATLIGCSVVYVAVLAEQQVGGLRARASLLPLLAPVIAAAGFDLVRQLSDRFSPANRPGVSR